MQRLLAFSHSGVLDVNRSFYRKMAETLEVDVTLVVPKRWRGDLIRDLRFEPRPEDSRIRVIPLPTAISGNGSLFVYTKDLSKLVNEMRPHHVFVHEEPWSLAAVQAFSAIREAPASFFTNQNIRKKLPFPFQRFERWVHAKSAHAYVLSQEAAEVLRWKGYQKDVRYLPFSYDPELFYVRSREDRERRRKQLGIPGDALVIGYLGRMEPEKGIDDLMSAIRMAAKRAELGHVHYLWVGNGVLADAVRGFTESLGQGKATHIPAVPHHEFGDTLACVDVLVLPSRTTPRWKEQFGRVLVEAMACGAAVIGSDSGEIPHLIRRTGGGLVFRERDSIDLCEQMIQLATDPARLRSLATQGQSAASRCFTHEAVARSMGEGLGLSSRASVSRGCV